MRKNVLALSIATMIGGLGFAGLSSAAVIRGAAPNSVTGLGISNANDFIVSAGGFGHQMIVPYFTTQASNQTVLHVVNSDTQNGKALKVRFRGAANSDDLLDFYVFLSPGDVWTSALTRGADGRTVLSTGDKSCTYPTIPSGGKDFSVGRLNPAWTAAQQADNTREGYVEFFVAADIPNRIIRGTATESALFTAVKHVSGIAPCTAAPIEAAMLTDLTTEALAAGAGYGAPTGGVTGSWYIINQVQNTTYSDANTVITAISGFSGKNPISAKANYIVFPQIDTEIPNPEFYTADPSLSTDLSLTATGVGRAKTATGTLTTALTAPVIKAAYYDLPDLSTPYVSVGPFTSATLPRTSAGALTDALAVKSILNQYATEASISAKTDWTFSFPTRRYSVAYDYSQPAATARVFSVVSAPTTTNQYFYTNNTTVSSTSGTPNVICVRAASQSFLDREETAATGGGVFSPSTVTQLAFCGETSVLSFGDAAGTSAIGSSVARTALASGFYTNGYSIVNVVDATTGLGLPLLGSSFQKITNNNTTGGAANATAGNFGILWPHAFTK